MRAALILAAIFALTLPAALIAGADSPGAGSAAYQVFVENEVGTDGVGTFTVMTGPAHPAGEGHEVLLSRDSPGDAATSYLTVRSYTTGVDYVQALGDVYSANIIYPLDPFGRVESIDGAAGYLTTYDVIDYDRLRIESAVRALENAAIISVSVTNRGDAPVELGVRYLLDIAPGGDDGPIASAPGVAATRERELDPLPSFVNVSPRSGAFAPVRYSVRSTTPEGASAALASWPDAFATSFDYTTAGQETSSENGGDAALLYFLGRTPEAAVTLAPGENLRFELMITDPGELCDNRADDDGDTLADGSDPDCALTPAPTATPPPPGPGPAATPAELPRTGAGPR